MASHNSALYCGTTTHTRKQPSRNRFTYHLYMALVDLDDLRTKRLDNWPIFSSTTPLAVTALLSRDHMVHEDPTRDLDSRVRDFVQRQSGTRPRGRIQLLTNLRVLGVEFNPVSFYYIFSREDPELVEGIVAEVANFPWFEQYPYYTEPQTVQTTTVRTSSPASSSPQVGTQLRPFRTVEKNFHVSPFMPFDGLRYNWQFSHPTQSNRIRISLTDTRDNDKSVFFASLDAQRKEWTSINLLKMQWQYPLYSLSVMFGILYEALKLLRAGHTFFPHPTGVTSRLSRLVDTLVSIGLFFNRLLTWWRGNKRNDASS